METCKEFFRNHKTTVIVTVGCVLLVVALLLCVSFLRGCESREGATTGVSEGSAEDPSAVSGGTSVAGSSADSGEGSESGASIESGASGVSIESGSPSESSEPGDEQSAGASSEPSLETSSKVPMVSEVEVSEPEQPAVSETPIDPPKPVEPPVEKQYKTAWGERPHEFEELKGVVNQGEGGSFYGSKLKQHSDGYGNTWYTFDGNIIGNNSIFDKGGLSLIDNYANYLGYGYWSNGLYYWSEDLPITPTQNGMIYANVPLKDQGAFPLPQDMPYGDTFESFFHWFFEDGYVRLISQCSDLDELVDLMNSIFEEDHLLYNPHLEAEHIERWCFEEINIHDYKDLLTAIADPFSYPFSPYTHEVKSA